jgi:hypothetical protein
MMNTEPDQFEQRLSRQPLRQVPPEWREEILAMASRESRVDSQAPNHSWSSSVVCRLSSVFWPHPVAWAGLAAIWVVIFAVKFSTHDRTPAVAQRTSPPPVEMILEVRQQQRLLAELLGPRETRDAERQRIFVPRPRSEHSGIMSA